MSLRKILAVAAALLVSSTGLVALTPAEPAAAATGGCGNRAHRAHTADRRPFNAWACWIDKGDNIRVCDNSPGNNRHAHAELRMRPGGLWIKIASEDDGPDRGCDTEDLKIPLKGGPVLLMLEICEQDNSQTKHRCQTKIWTEHES